jgi:hypothetical protein
MPGSPQRSATTIDERSSVSSSTARDRFLDLVLSAVAADQIEAEPRAPGGAPPRVPKTIDLTQNRKVTPKTTQTMLPPNLCPSHGLPMVWRMEFSDGDSARMCRACWWGYALSHRTEREYASATDGEMHFRKELIAALPKQIATWRNRSTRRPLLRPRCESSGGKTRAGKVPAVAVLVSSEESGGCFGR